MKAIITLFLVLLSSFSISDTITIETGGFSCPSYFEINGKYNTSSWSYTKDYTFDLCRIKKITSDAISLDNDDYFYVLYNTNYIEDIKSILTYDKSSEESNVINIKSGGHNCPALVEAVSYTIDLCRVVLIDSNKFKMEDGSIINFGSDWNKIEELKAMMPMAKVQPQQDEEI